MVGLVHADGNRGKLYDLGRIVSFSDGVVAIGITLLILPLADINLPHLNEPGGQEASTNPIGYIWSEYQSLIVSFVVSWVVIFVFWLGHHRVFEQLQYVTTKIILWNGLWLFAIVILPFPTNLVGQMSNDIASNQIPMLYLLNLFILGLAVSMIGYECRNTPEVFTDEARPEAIKRTLWGLFDMPAYLLLLTVVAYFFGIWAMWGLYALPLFARFSGRFEKSYRERRAQ